jgi:hypothetical protein
VRSTSWYPVSSGSKLPQTSSEKRRVSKVPPIAMARHTSEGRPFERKTSSPIPPVASRKSAVAMGVNTSQLSKLSSM